MSEKNKYGIWVGDVYCGSFGTPNPFIDSLTPEELCRHVMCALNAFGRDGLDPQNSDDLWILEWREEVARRSAA